MNSSQGRQCPKFSGQFLLVVIEFLLECLSD